MACEDRCRHTGTFGRRRVGLSHVAGQFRLSPFAAERGEILEKAVGWEGHRASEDEAAAGAILHRLHSRGAELDVRARRVVEVYLSRSVGTLRNNSAARRLKRLGYEGDLEFCLAEDTVPVVPRLVGYAFVG